MHMAQNQKYILGECPENQNLTDLKKSLNIISYWDWSRGISLLSLKLPEQNKDLANSVIC